MTENQNSIVDEKQETYNAEVLNDQETETIVESTELSEKDKKKNFPNFADLLSLLGVFFLSSMASMLITEICGINAQSNIGLQTFLVYVISFGVTLMFAVPYSYYRSKRTFNPLQFSFKGINMATILWGFILVLSLGVVLEPLTMTFDKQYIEQLSQIMGSGDWVVLSALVFAPIFEEILFRGVIQGALTNRYNVFVGIIVSAVIFGLVHGNPVQMCNAFFVGLVLGYIYHRTGTLWTVMILHFFNNLFSYFTWMLGGQSIVSLSEVITNPQVYNVIYAVASVVTLVSFVLLFRALKAKPEPQLDNKLS